MRAKTSLILFLIGATLSPLIAVSHANQPGHFGIGGILGEPTGVSAKYTIDRQFAVQGALGLSLVERGVWLSTDFLIHIHNVFGGLDVLPLYVGGGLVIQDRGNIGRDKVREASLGVRGVVGVEWLVQNRISIFGEASAQPFILPSLGFGISVAAGARYWF
jgi:hypothetical protein